MGELVLENKPKFTRAVVGYLITGEEVILGLRKKVSFELGENLIAGIGGKVGDIEGHETETEEEALIREFEEEVGVTPIKFYKVGEIEFIFPNKPKWNQSVAAYIIEEWNGKPVETEAIRPRTFPVGSLPNEQMWDDNQYWVPIVLDGETVKARFVYGEDNKTVENYDIQRGVTFE